MRLAGTRLLLGVTGGIAAYKSPLILRHLQEEGAQVRVVRTRNAARFVTDETLAALSGHPVHGDLFAISAEFPVLHVGLAGWAQGLVVAPATANLVNKLAAGIADDLLTTLYLALPVPVLLAPAMETRMWASSRLQANVERLRAEGVGIVEPEVGYLASGASGQGRMADPARVVDETVSFLQAHLAAGGPGATAAGDAGDLRGCRFLVTAGPTVEDLDPVRFLSNRSSGKMGYAVAARARARGAQVDLVSGPTQLPPPPGVRLTQVRSAVQMHAATMDRFADADVAVMAAAVSDFRPRQVWDHKLKRGAGALTLELVENPDIAADLGRRKGGRVLVVFAMETEDGVARARAKLVRKGADLVALNDLTVPGAGFGLDTNVVTLLDAVGGQRVLPLLSKFEVADRILDAVRERLPPPR